MSKLVYGAAVGLLFIGAAVWYLEVRVSRTARQLAVYHTSDQRFMREQLRRLDGKEG